MADFIFDISTIVQGNNGNKLPLTIRNNGTVHAIEGATVRVTIKRGTSVFTKQAIITDASSGKCEVVLSSEDLTHPGLYFYQPTISYTDGREISGDVSSFTVRGKLSGEAPPVTVPAGIDLSRLGISANNRLTIDGIEQIGGGTGGGTTEPLPSNVILFEDWVGGESVTIDTGTTQPPVDTTAPVLTISPAGGNFASNQGVTMTTNETADIYYTLDGSTPTTASPKYATPLSLSATTALKAFARDTAGNSSAVQTVTFTKDVTAPADTTAPLVTASPAAGTYTSAQSVTLSANETATIYYTTNGTTPTTASNVYATPISIGATTTLQFMAKDTAGNQSAPVAATYTINIPQADTTAPVLTMTAAATFADTQTVNMSANETADIWYTVDGSDPIASGTRVKYSAPVTLTATTTVKAYAVDTAGNASGVQTVTYTKQVSTPYVSDGLKVYYDYSALTSTPTTVTDLSGNGNNGTLYGFAGTATSGVNNGELVSDGTQDYVKFLHKSDLKTYPFTLEFYSRIKPPANTASNSITLFDIQNTTGTGNGVRVIMNRTDNTNTATSIGVVGSTSNPPLYSYNHNGNLFDDAYRHIVIVFGSSYQKIYVNGSLVGTQNANSAVIGTSTRDFNLYMAGSDANGATTINGAHKLFRFYTKELTQSEITQNYNDVI